MGVSGCALEAPPHGDCGARGQPGGTGLPALVLRWTKSCVTTVLREEVQDAKPGTGKGLAALSMCPSASCLG